MVTCLCTIRSEWLCLNPKQQASTPSLDIYQSRSGLEEHGALHRVELHDFALCDYVVYKYRIVNASTVCISMYDMTPAFCRSRFFSVCDRAEIKKKVKVNKVKGRKVNHALDRSAREAA